MSKHSAYAHTPHGDAYPELPSRRQIHQTPRRAKLDATRSPKKSFNASAASQKVAMVAAVSGLALTAALPTTAAISANGENPQRQQITPESLEVTADPNASLQLSKPSEITKVDPDQQLRSIVSASAAKVTPEASKGTLDFPLNTPMQINSPFGPRVAPVGGVSNFHNGLDLQAACGVNVDAAAEGTVKSAGWDNTGYGNRVVVDHGNGLETTYNHMSSVAVKVGDKVSRGQQVGSAGTTGASTGCHLHFEVQVNGETIDPLKWL